MMRRLAFWTAAPLLSLGIVYAADIFSQLGTTEASVRDNLLHALKTGTVPTGMAAKPYYALPAAAQAKLVDGYFAWARTYTASAAFKRAYADERAAAKPEPAETADPDSPSAQTEQQKQFDEMKKAMASLPPEQRKQMEEAMKEMQKQLADPQVKKMMAEGAKMQREENAKRHQADLAEWNERFPENPQVLIARRLRHFLEISATVDFDAKLLKSNDTMKFAETRYEDKPAEWKLCYRAGRSAVTAAQAAARAWLKDLPAAK